ncbi:hypothetical protein E4U25_004130 [Claviceps purpurea]|nr:hypothetical protein E4U25_004130 [Claviceps purpurea]
MAYGRAQTHIPLDSMGLGDVPSTSRLAETHRLPKEDALSSFGLSGCPFGHTMVHTTLHYTIELEAQWPLAEYLDTLFF